MRKKLIILNLIFILDLGFALHCFSCDSNFDPNCATLVKNTSAILCEDDNEQCAAWTIGSNTFRGCMSQKDESVTQFESCADGDLCNNDIFPKDRLKCITCSANNANCIAPSANLLYPCKNYVENDKCYSYIINETSVIRGCMSDDNENVATCQAAHELCTQCNEEFCNFQSGYSNIECIACSSDENPACGYHLPLDHQFTTHVCAELVSRDNFCVSFRNNSKFYRGCLNDFEEISVESCLESDDCEICEENLCNNKQLTVDECFECDSRIENCEKFEIFSQKSVICKEVTVDKSGCYHFDNGEVIRRGCISSLSIIDYETCSTDSSCKFCQGNKCNYKETFQKCYSCDSFYDLNCVTVQNKLPEKICDEYLDTCKVFVKPNMTTHRGCSNELESAPECSSSRVNCKQCDEPLCNGGIFPTTRLTCYQCQSSVDSNCIEEISNQSLSFPCENYNFRDSCYLYLDINNNSIRGCLSDSNVYADLCTSNSSHCDICNTSNCNNKSVKRRPSLSCIKCDSVSDPKCLWGFSESAAMPCLRDLYFYEEESCFTFHVSENTIIRQCTLDSNVCLNNPRCSLCKTNACNIEQKVSLHCHECSSSKSSACLNDLERIGNVSCQGPVTYENRGCFTWKNSDKNVTRGCLSNLSATRKFQCINDHENCEICVNGSNCNEKIFNYDSRNIPELVVICVFVMIVIIF